jgi:hypothetical protein
MNAGESCSQQPPEASHCPQDNEKLSPGLSPKVRNRYIDAVVRAFFLNFFLCILMYINIPKRLYKTMLYSLPTGPFMTIKWSKNPVYGVLEAKR